MVKFRALSADPRKYFPISPFRKVEHKSTSAEEITGKNHVERYKESINAIF